MKKQHPILSFVFTMVVRIAEALTRYSRDFKGIKR